MRLIRIAYFESKHLLLHSVASPNAKKYTALQAWDAYSKSAVLFSR